jgi:hypothetical protein
MEQIEICAGLLANFQDLQVQPTKGETKSP